MKEGFASRATRARWRLAKSTLRCGGASGTVIPAQKLLEAGSWRERLRVGLDDLRRCR